MISKEVYKNNSYCNVNEIKLTHTLLFIKISRMISITIPFSETEDKNEYKVK